MAFHSNHLSIAVAADVECDEAAVSRFANIQTCVQHLLMGFREEIFDHDFGVPHVMGQTHLVRLNVSVLLGVASLM